MVRAVRASPASLTRLGLLAALLAGAPVARAADTDGSARLQLQLVGDSNPARDLLVPGDTRTDVGAAVATTLEGRVAGERYLLTGQYDAGLRGYVRFPGESALVQAARGEASLALGRYAGVGLGLQGKDRRGGSRAYTDLGARAFVELVPDARLDLRAWAGVTRFVYRPAPEASYGGPEVGATGRYRFDRRHAALLLVEGGRRRYSVQARPRPGREPSGERRADGLLGATVGYQYRGPFALEATYGYQELASNAFGETVLRHRLAVSAGVRLPWRLSLLAQGALVLQRYPDGVWLSPDVVLPGDDEGSSSLAARLVRPLGERVDLELSVAAQGARLPRSGLRYAREVVTLGVSLRL